MHLFRHRGRVDWPLLALFAAINALVLLNALIHNHRVGYDTLDGHLPYIVSLGQLQLPSPDQSRAFFSPPLPYLLPAAVYAAALRLIRLPIADLAALALAGKAAQLQNVVVSLGLTFGLLGVCEQMRPGDSTLKRTSLGLLGVLPLYYKNFAFVRGEPLLAGLTVLALYQAGPLLAGAPARRVLGLGLTLGMLILSRQWGFFVLGAIGLLALLLARRRGLAPLRTIGASLGLAALIGGWFYLLLAVRYDSAFAFNRAPGAAPLWLSQPASFYLAPDSGLLLLRPIYPAFANQLIPVFYAEMWGDYWGHFVLTAYHPFFANPYGVSAAYLGRVAGVSLLPMALLLAGLVGGLVATADLAARPQAASQRQITLALLTLVVLVSLAGYLWFLVRYPSHGRGDTIKASYMLQIFPPLAILGGELLQAIRRRRPRGYALAVGLLLLAAAYSAPIYVTRYIEPAQLYLQRLGW